jgi:hypothetical protein
MNLLGARAQAEKVIRAASLPGYDERLPAEQNRGGRR